MHGTDKEAAKAFRDDLMTWRETAKRAGAELHVSKNGAWKKMQEAELHVTNWVRDQKKSMYTLLTFNDRLLDSRSFIRLIYSVSSSVLLPETQRAARLVQHLAEAVGFVIGGS